MMDQPVVMILTALKRPDPKHNGCYLWLIANGMNMGRWTGLFGVNCLADLMDNTNYISNMAGKYPNAEIEEYRLIKEED